MSKAQEALPPSYEEAMRGTTDAAFAGASAPVMSSPEHAPLVPGAVMPMPPIATDHSMPPNIAMPPGGPGGIVPVPPMAASTGPVGTPQPIGMAPQGPMPMYPMQPAAVPTTVYVSPPPVGPKPCTLTCPVCHQKVRTTTTVTNTGSAHAICILMCLLGCCCCSCLPYCFDSMKITKHECPCCKTYLGSYKP